MFGNFSAHRCVNYRERMRRGVLGGVVSNWGSVKPEYMQRNNQYMIGHYKLTYEDEEIAYLPIKYGTNIGPKDKSAAITSVREAAYSTLPTLSNDGYMYEHTYENPRPNSKIVKIEYIPCIGKENIKIDYKFNIT